MPLGFVFSPGWGFDERFFAHLSRFLEPYPTLAWSPGLSSAFFSDKIWIGIGHSFGFHRLLALPLKGFVSLSGFVRFCSHNPSQPGIPVRVLERMIEKFKNKPEKVLEIFYQQCHLEPAEHQIPFNQRTLLRDLESMKGLDATNELTSLTVPILYLWAQDDQIVPLSLSQDLLNNGPTLSRFIILPKGGHGFPFTHAQECASYITQWTQEVQF